MPPPQSATIAQAKRSYKDRGRPQLSEREQKQLSRAVELDRRAQRTKEQEKRRVEAARKRAEKEKRLKEAEQRAQVCSQRRHDRFGFASSQAHLGRWFGGGGKATKQEVDTAEGKAQYNMGSFEDELDDEDLMDAVSISDDDGQHSTPPLMPPPALPATSVHTFPKASMLIHDPKEVDLLMSDLESSTQIARDLDQQTPSVQSDTRLNSNQITCNTSFGSEGFDLSVEEIEALDAKAMMEAKQEHDRRTMPPPPIRLRTRANDRPITAMDAHTSPYPGKIPSTSPGLGVDALAETQVSDDIGFTSSQLENFIDDDIRLTQACPG